MSFPSLVKFQAWISLNREKERRALLVRRRSFFSTITLSLQRHKILLKKPQLDFEPNISHLPGLAHRRMKEKLKRKKLAITIESPRTQWLRKTIRLWGGSTIFYRGMGVIERDQRMTWGGRVFFRFCALGQGFRKV